MMSKVKNSSFLCGHLSNDLIDVIQVSKHKYHIFRVFYNLFNINIVNSKSWYINSLFVSILNKRSEQLTLFYTYAFTPYFK
jgi:hypothetical protein